jgi:hypothetical protein
LRAQVFRDLRDEGIFSKDTNIGGIDLNISALIVYKVALNLVGDNNYFVFLLPESVIKDKSFEGFRNKLANKISKIEKILEPEKE